MRKRPPCIAKRRAPKSSGDRALQNLLLLAATKAKNTLIGGWRVGEFKRIFAARNGWRPLGKIKRVPASGRACRSARGRRHCRRFGLGRGPADQHHLLACSAQARTLLERVRYVQQGGAVGTIHFHGRRASRTQQGRSYRAMARMQGSISVNTRKGVGQFASANGSVCGVYWQSETLTVPGSGLPGRSHGLSCRA